MLTSAVIVRKELDQRDIHRDLEKGAYIGFPISVRPSLILGNSLMTVFILIIIIYIIYCILYLYADLYF